VPKSLPSGPSLDHETQQQMSLAHHLLGRLDEAASRLPDPAVLVRTTRYQEIRSMLALRGVPMAAEEIAYLGLPGGPRGTSPQDKVVRYVESVEKAIRSVRTTKTTGWALVRVATCFAQLADESAGGGEPPWLFTKDWLANAPGIRHRDRAAQWVAWIDTPSDLLLIGKVAVGAHLLYELEPFTYTPDLAHVYVTLELIRDGALRDQIVATSLHIERNRARFQRIHQSTVETGDYNEWVRFFAEGVVAQCRNQLNLVEQLEQLRHKNMATMRERRRDSFARFVSNLTSFQVITAPLAAERCETSVKYAREMLRHAEELGMVVELGKRKRNKVYEVREVRRLMERFAGMVPAADLAVHERIVP
jgi:ribosomal protein S25